MRCRTKEGKLRLVHEGVEYHLDGNGLDLPDELAESIRPHRNVVVESEPAPPRRSEGRRGSRKPSADEESEDAE